jgi:hypothetical protein
MAAMHGGQWVAAGTYMGLKEGEWIAVPEKGGRLPGGESERYLRMRAAVILGPLFGLVYFIFVPIAGAVVGCWLGAKAVVRKLSPVRVIAGEQPQTKKSH